MGRCLPSDGSGNEQRRSALNFRKLTFAKGQKWQHAVLPGTGAWWEEGREGRWEDVRGSRDIIKLVQRAGPRPGASHVSRDLEVTATEQLNQEVRSVFVVRKCFTVIVVLSVAAIC